MSFILVTPCTGYKVRGRDPIPTAIELPEGPQHTVERAWRDALKKSQPTYIPAALYQGISYKFILPFARRHKVPLYTISAGLGLLSPDSIIPEYDLTVGAGPSRIQSRVIGEFCYASWWKSNNKGQPYPIAHLVKRFPQTRFLFALPQSYLDLVRADLEQIPRRAFSRLRFFATKLPESGGIFDLYMPYTKAMDLPGSPVPGGGVSGPQRRLIHYVEHIMQTGSSVADDKQAIREVMAGIKNIERRRVSDKELAQIMQEERKLYPDMGRTAFLAHINQTKAIAGDHTRMRRIYKQTFVEDDRRALGFFSK